MDLCNMDMEYILYMTYTYRCLGAAPFGSRTSYVVVSSHIARMPLGWLDRFMRDTCIYIYIYIYP